MLLLSSSVRPSRRSIAAAVFSVIGCTVFSTSGVAPPYRAVNGPVIVAQFSGAPDVPENAKTVVREGHALGADWVEINVTQRSVATLEEVLGDSGRTMVAMKSDDAPQRLADAVLGAVKATFAYDRVLIASSDPVLLDAVIIRDPAIPLVGIVSELNRLDEMLDRGPRVLAIRNDLAEEAIKRIPEGVAVWAWTVTTVEEAQRLLELGVHGLVTDQPAALIDAVRGEVDPYVERVEP